MGLEDSSYADPRLARSTILQANAGLCSATPLELKHGRQASTGTGTPGDGTRPTENGIADFGGVLGITKKVFFDPPKNTVFLQFLKRVKRTGFNQ